MFLRTGLFFLPGSKGCKLFGAPSWEISSNFLAGQFGGMVAKGLTNHMCFLKNCPKTTNHVSGCFRQFRQYSCWWTCFWMLSWGADCDQILFASCLFFCRGCFKYLRYGIFPKQPQASTTLVFQIFQLPMLPWIRMNLCVLANFA